MNLRVLSSLEIKHANIKKVKSVTETLSIIHYL